MEEDKRFHCALRSGAEKENDILGFPGVSGPFSDVLLSGMDLSSQEREPAFPDADEAEVPAPSDWTGIFPEAASDAVRPFFPDEDPAALSPEGRAEGLLSSQSSLGDGWISSPSGRGIDYRRDCADVPADFRWPEAFALCFRKENIFSPPSLVANTYMMTLVFAGAFCLIAFMESYRFPLALPAALLVTVIVTAVFRHFFRPRFFALFDVLSQGRRTEAFIVSCRRGRRPAAYREPSSYGGSCAYYVTWLYRDGEGRVYRKTCCYPPYEKFYVPPGSIGYVYYDPSAPENSIWIGDDWKQYGFAGRSADGSEYAG